MAEEPWGYSFIAGNASKKRRKKKKKTHGVSSFYRLENWGSKSDSWTPHKTSPALDLTLRSPSLGLFSPQNRPQFLYNLIPSFFPVCGRVEHFIFLQTIPKVMFQNASKVASSGENATEMLSQIWQQSQVEDPGLNLPAALSNARTFSLCFL